jgi:hypothetical protein
VAYLGQSVLDSIQGTIALFAEGRYLNNISIEYDLQTLEVKSGSLYGLVKGVEKTVFKID